MQYNQRTNYRVSPELAHEWWKEIQGERFSVVSTNAFLANPRQYTCDSNGPWVVFPSTHVADLVGVVTQPLTDGSGQWGLAVLWYDREKCSPISRIFHSRKLSQSKEAAALVGQVILRQGGAAF